MACPDENVLVQMIERSLDPGMFGELEAHIDTCDSCRQAVGALLAVGTPPATRDAEPAGSAPVGDRYEIIEVLGRGGMGTVYRARDRQLAREVALKLHRPGTGKERLHREAIAMAQLAHPNVVAVFEVTNIDDRLCVAMEYVRGTTLRGWLAEQPRTWREIVALLVETGRGLAAAHAAGLVHRDFKPENVLVGTDGRPRVGDFGLASVSGAPAPKVTTPSVTDLTVTGAVMGTPAYMAPEQFAGEIVDARCDQFAFCVVAWEALYGARPFAGATLDAVQLAIERGDLQQPPARGVPDRVRRVLARGLQALPSARYPDLDALLAALRTAAAPRTGRRIAFAAAALVTLGGAGFATASIVTSRRHEAACVAEGDAVRAAFDPSARAAVQRAFTQTHSPLAGSAFEHTAPVLEHYASALADRTTAACRADQHAELAAARRACLREHASALATLVGALAKVDDQLVVSAPNAAWGLVDQAPCEDLSVRRGPPATPEQAAELGAIRALMGAGRYADGAARAQALRDRAHASGDKHVELDALLLLGQLRQELESPDATAIMQQAASLAEGLGRDTEAAVAFIALANLSGPDKHDYTTAHRYAELAHAKLERLGGGTPAIRGLLAVTEAQLLMDEDRLGEAEAAARRGVSALEQAYGAEHPKVGEAHGVLSEILRGEHEDAESLSESERTLAVLGRALGEDHPSVAGAEMNLGSALLAQNRLDDARGHLTRADAVFSKIYGPDHPVHAAIAGNLGDLEMGRKDYAAARTAFRTALHVLEHAEGVVSPGASGAHRDIARTFAAEGNWREAMPEAERGLAILEQLGADGEPRLVGALTELAEYQLAQHHVAEALPLAERAVAVATRRGADANASELADAQKILAEIRRASR